MPKPSACFTYSLALLLTASLCAPSFAESEPDVMASFSVEGTQGTVIALQPLAEFDSAWAMAFLPDGRALVSEKNGDIWLINKDGSKAGKISGGPEVEARGQGGMGDIIVHPDFATNGTVFLSYVERDENKRKLSGSVVERATLILGSKTGKFKKRTRIWQQSHKVKGNGHYGQRLVLSPDGFLFISSGERQKFKPAQNMAMNLGKSIRLNQDGTAPTDNPFYVGDSSPADQIWTLGHRNPLGIAFDSKGRLWMSEMGPRGGDELNLITRGENYGYPKVSEGRHYSGINIADHDEMPEYTPPKIAWVPSISPAGLVFYTGEIFQDWQGDAFLGGLSSRALVRVSFEQDESETISVSEAERYEWESRIREIEQGPDGALYILEDKEGGRLIRITPPK